MSDNKGVKDGGRITKRRQIFKIQRENEESQDDEEELTSRSEEENLELTEAKRISAYSKVNFSKLSDAEKDERLKNQAKLVKRLRRKVRNLEKKFKCNANKVLNKYFKYYNKESVKKEKKQSNISSPTLNDKGEVKKMNWEINIEKLCKAIKVLRNHENFEYEDQAHVLENFINLIAEDKIPFDSINFKKICTQIRLFLKKEKIRYIGKKGKEITFGFPEKDVYITKKEYEAYSRFKDSEATVRTILGVFNGDENDTPPEKIKFDSTKQTSSCLTNVANAEQNNTNLVNTLLTMSLLNQNQSTNAQALLMNPLYSNIIQQLMSVRGNLNNSLFSNNFSYNSS